MLSYWILKRPDGRPAGLVRVNNDRVTLTVNGEIAGSFTLFSDTAAVPIVPQTETVLPGAAALLGAEGDRVTCFAAAPNAETLAAYRYRLSQIHTMTAPTPAPEPSTPEPTADLSRNSTMKAEDTSETQEDTEDMSQISTIETDSVSKTARDTAEFSMLLQHAEAFFAAYEGEAYAGSVDKLVQKVDKSAERETGGFELFSQEFPGARWRYVDGADVLSHYEGTWRQPNGQTVHILAVRGHAAPRPPRALLGFTRFMRDAEGNGYWLRLTPLP